MEKQSGMFKINARGYSHYVKKKDNKWDLNDEKFGWIVLGTGLTESIIGASLAMHGQKCLFLDRSDKYGGTISNFNLEQYLKYIDTQLKTASAPFHSFKVLVPFDKNGCPDIMAKDNDFKRFSRQFNIDLAPKILFSKSQSVDNLIKSGVASYLEFNNVSENYFFNPKDDNDGHFEEADMVKIPFSKSEIFVNQVLTFKEKRLLVKAIEMCLEGTDNLDKIETEKDQENVIKKKSQNSTHQYDKEVEMTEAEKQEILGKLNEPIRDMFESLNMEKRLKDILCYALGMLTESNSDMTCATFYQRIAKYLRSIGYYGDSPFMMCNYGSSEYAQAFSRVGSLFGNVYIVNEDLDIQDLGISEDGKIESIEVNYNDQPISLVGAEASGQTGIIAGPQFLKDLMKPIGKNVDQAIKSTEQIIRMTLITRKPILAESPSLSTYIIAPETPFIQNCNPIRIYQQNHHIDVAPRGTFLQLISMKVRKNLDINEQLLQVRRAVQLIYGLKHDESAKDHAYKDFENQDGTVEPQTEEQKDQQENIFFAVEYIQNFVDIDPKVQGISNLWVVPDETFEVDLDDNFANAYNKVLKDVKIETINNRTFLMRPQDRENQGNLDAYDEDEYGDDDPDEDDLDPFGVDKEDNQDELDIF